MIDRKQQLTDRYIRGEMTSAERLSFEKQMSDDEELREIYNYTLKISNAVKDRNEKLDKINQWKEQERIKKGKKFHHTAPGKFTYATFGVAALIAIFFFFNRCPDMPELNTRSYECYRGSCSVYHVANLIKEEQYTKALYVIEGEEQEYKEDVDSIKHLIPSASAEHLKQLNYEMAAVKSDYDELRWLKVYAYIGLKKHDKATKLLKEIKSSEGRYKGKADSVLNKLIKI